MTERQDDTSRTTLLPEIHAVPDDVVSDTNAVVDEQYFIDAARDRKACQTQLSGESPLDGVKDV